MTWSAFILQACVDLIFVFDDCLAQFSSKYVLQEEQHQVVFGLLGQKNVVAVLPTGLGESLI